MVNDIYRKNEINMAEKKDKAKKTTRKPKTKKEEAPIIANEMKIEETAASNKEESAVSEVIKVDEIAEIKEETPIKKNESKKETKLENKTPKRNIDNMFGYSWNGQEMDF